MKRILITGANSYIGTSFEKYIKEKYSKEYEIETLDMLDLKWRTYDFSKYDSVFHVAGIAHADVGRVSEERKQQYYQVNCDLAVETAKKAKEANVKQFIYMSSIIVYGESAPIGKKKVITSETKPEPANFYGDSKLQADIQLQKIADEKYKVCILRPPMIYGEGSKGNYQLLTKLAKTLPIFPNIKNERSVLYIGNLCEIVKECIDKESEGIYFPQNAEYVSTSELVKQIAEANGKRMILTRVLNPLVYLTSKVPGKVGSMCNKAFGSMVYSKDTVIDTYAMKRSVQKVEKIR